MEYLFLFVVVVSAGGGFLPYLGMGCDRGEIRKKNEFARSFEDLAARSPGHESG
jgi:hypothetical protein